MGDVVDLNSQRPHVHGEAFCLACGHGWDAVAVVGTALFLCPECGSLKGRLRHPVTLGDDEQVWMCNCGNTYMEYYHNHGLVCVVCGQAQRLD